MALMSTDHVNGVKAFSGWPHPATIVRQSLSIPTTGTGVTSPKWNPGASNPTFRTANLSAITAAAGANSGLRNVAQKILGPATIGVRHAARPEDYLNIVRKLRF